MPVLSASKIKIAKHFNGYNDPYWNDYRDYILKYVKEHGSKYIHEQIDEEAIDRPDKNLLFVRILIKGK